MKLLNRISASQLFVVIACVYLAGFFAHALYLGKTVYGDGIYYYSWLRTPVIDHVLSFPQGNKYSIGPAIAWSPAFILIHGLIRGDGNSLPYQLGVGLTSVLATIFALVLLWRLLNRYFGGTVSIMTVTILAGASNLLFYGSVDVVNSHALTFFAATVFLTLIFVKHKQWLVIGIVLGFLGVIRTQDLIYGILLIPLLKKNNVLPLITGVVISFVPQLVAWQLVYGRFWTSPYLLHEGFNFLEPHIFGVLFNIRSGLFLWTPVTLVGAVGLFTGRTNRIRSRIWMIGVFLLELYVVSSWSTWWQGASYSGRMFVSTLPILSFGVASIFTWLAKFRWTQSYYLLTIVAPLSALNVLSIIYFLLMPGR